VILCHYNDISKKKLTTQQNRTIAFLFTSSPFLKIACPRRSKRAQKKVQCARAPRDSLKTSQRFSQFELKPVIWCYLQPSTSVLQHFCSRRTARYHCAKRPFACSMFDSVLLKIAYFATCDCLFTSLLSHHTDI
jgi:hypothetical protein